jgi:hypothetical protein
MSEDPQSRPTAKEVLQALQDPQLMHHPGRQRAQTIEHHGLGYGRSGSGRGGGKGGGKGGDGGGKGGAGKGGGGYGGGGYGGGGYGGGGVGSPFNSYDSGGVGSSLGRNTYMTRLGIFRDWALQKTFAAPDENNRRNNRPFELASFSPATSPRDSPRVGRRRDRSGSEEGVYSRERSGSAPEAVRGDANRGRRQSAERREGVGQQGSAALPSTVGVPSSALLAIPGPLMPAGRDKAHVPEGGSPGTTPYTLHSTPAGSPKAHANKRAGGMGSGLQAGNQDGVSAPPVQPRPQLVVPAYGASSL